MAIITLLVSASAVTPRAAATPDKQKVCSSCHSGTPSGTVTAVPSSATLAPGANYSVAISIGLSSSGKTGYWIANSDGAATTGTTTGVFGGPGSGASWNPTMKAPATPGTYYYKVWCVKGLDNNTGQAKAASYSITVATPPPPTDTVAPTTTASGAIDNGWYHLPTVVTLTAADNSGGSGVASLAWTLDGTPQSAPAPRRR